jgi:hypothetical protein
VNYAGKVSGAVQMFQNFEKRDNVESVIWIPSDILLQSHCEKRIQAVFLSSPLNGMTVEVYTDSAITVMPGC